MSEGYNGIRKRKERRATALVEIDVVDRKKKSSKKWISQN